MKKLIALVVASTVAGASLALADQETTLTNPNTGDRVTVRTDDRNTTSTHSDGTSGTTSGSPRHDETVRDYERGGYHRDR